MDGGPLTGALENSRRPPYRCPSRALRVDPEKGEAPLDVTHQLVSKGLIAEGGDLQYPAVNTFATQGGSLHREVERNNGSLLQMRGERDRPLTSARFGTEKASSVSTVRIAVFEILFQDGVS